MPDTPTPTWRLVPPEPDAKQLDAAVAFALNVSLSAEYSWSAYMRDLYLRFLKFAPSPQELPPITLPPPPGHPEPHTMQWTALELRAIEAYARAAIAADRRAGGR